LRRHAIGIIALVLLAGALVLMIRSDPGPMAQEGTAACLRIGILMVFVWLAYDQLSRVPRWLWFTFPPLVVMLAIRPKWAIYLVPVLFLLALLKPKAKTGGTRRRSP
jgi:hypothetical protein